MNGTRILTKEVHCCLDCPLKMRTFTMDYVGGSQFKCETTGKILYDMRKLPDFCPLPRKTEPAPVKYKPTGGGC